MEGKTPTGMHLLSHSPRNKKNQLKIFSNRIMGLDLFWSKTVSNIIQVVILVRNAIHRINAFSNYSCLQYE